MARTLYPLPDVINPENRRCVILSIPDEIGHITAFLGAIYNLSKWYSWDRDENKTGALVAEVWKQIYDDLQSTIWEGCGELQIADFRQNGCVLEALIGGQWIPIFTVQSDCVTSIVNQGISNGTINIGQGGRGDSRAITSEIEQSTTVNGNLDAVWGGCLELTEYVFETLRLILDLLQATGDAVEALYKWLGKLKDKIKRTVKDKNGNDIEIGQDIVIGDDGELLQDLPVDQYGNDTSIDMNKVLSFFENMLDIGVAVIRAGLTETFLEEVACELFTILTCLPNETRTDNNITLTTGALYEWANTLMQQTPLDAIVGVTIVADNIIGSTDFFSFMNLGDAFRQYRIGTLDPFPTWTEICVNCGGVQTYTHTFDFTQGQFGFVPRAGQPNLSTWSSDGFISTGNWFGGGTQYKQAGFQGSKNLGSSNIKTITVNYIANNSIGAWHFTINGNTTNLNKGTGTLSTTRDFSNNPLTGTVTFDIFMHFLRSLPTLGNVFKSMTITGDGVNPFI